MIFFVRMPEVTMNLTPLHGELQEQWSPVHCSDTNLPVVSTELFFYLLCGITILLLNIIICNMYYWDWHLYFKYILLYFKYLFLYFLHRIRFFEIVFIQHYHYKISLDHSRLYLIRSGLSFWKRILSVNHLDLGDPKVVRS